jgi:hypothetical protein
VTKPYSEHVDQKTRNLLWAVSAGRCQFCNKIISRDWLTQKRGNFAEVAHIIGNRLDISGREKKKLPPEYCNDVQNLMLLCPEHHRLIDYEDPGAYPDSTLRLMKETHEQRMEALTNIDKDRTSAVIKYGANIETHDAVLSTSDAHRAIAVAGWYPARATPILLGILNSTLQDHEAEYWKAQEKELVRRFEREVRPYIGEGARNHFSVFGLAPIPLLVKLGSLLSDLHQVEVYQLHREPQTWEWQPGPVGFEYLIEEPLNTKQLVALNLSLSATITNERITRILGEENVSIWRMTIERPNNDFLKGREQLQQFRIAFRQLLDQIKTKHGEEAVLHIFPAVPVSVAVEMGRVRQPKADLPMLVYDQNRAVGGFIQALRIG